MWSVGAVSDEDRLDRVETGRVLRRAFGMARAQRPLFVLALGYIVISTLVTLAGPTIVRYAIDHGIQDADTGMLNTMVVLYLVVTVIGYVVGRLQFVTLNRAGEGFLRDLRITVFDKLQRQSMSYFDREKAGVLVSRMTADVESMSELIQFGLLQFISAFLLLNLAIVLLLVLSWELALVTLLVLPLLFIASVRFQRLSNKAYLDVRNKVGANLSTLQEGITG
ncbi:MAG: ABC transporter transmembrane domain-containing protein, partial [Actinomycetota bacterium]